MAQIYPRNVAPDVPPGTGTSPADAAITSEQKAQILGLGAIATWTVPLEVTVRVGRTAANGTAQAVGAIAEVAPDYPGDLDPAAPRQGEYDGDLSTAADLANFGDLRPSERAPHAPDLAPPAFGTPRRLAINIDKAQAFLHACETSHPRVTYGLGKKVPFLGACQVAISPRWTAADSFAKRSEKPKPASHKATRVFS